ncbi:MAG: hypothetical protein EZS28_028637 [Streblomastix strix]|uniref:Uncharacterized protein n=1 Tax=Streblomastix strix TaxID=222440 RepID=A0A5J4UYR9_9EUKA|nr:MAG: hypothetical protein EZS28_028637 [Streblomastix strix]
MARTPSPPTLILSPQQRWRSHPSVPLPNPFKYADSNSQRFLSSFHPSRGLESSSQFNGLVLKFVGTIDNVVFQNEADPMLKASVHCIQPVPGKDTPEGQQIQLIAYRNKPGIPQSFITLYNTNQDKIFSIFAYSLHDKLSDQFNFILELIGFGIATQQQLNDGTKIYLELGEVTMREDLAQLYIQDRDCRIQLNLQRNEDLHQTQIADQDRLQKFIPHVQTRLPSHQPPQLTRQQSLPDIPQNQQLKQSNVINIRIKHIWRNDWNLRVKCYNIPDQIMKIVKERICPLIHLNCPPDINCQQCINVLQSPALLKLKSAVFQSLADASYDNNEFKNMLVNDHNIIPHLTHPLIQFASQSQLDKKSDSQEQHDQQQTESTSSLSLITQSLDLLKRLIYDNNNICKVVINTPNALHSLCTLSGCKFNIHFNKEYDLQTFEVRDSSRWCLWYIQQCGDSSTQSELINARYVGVLVIAISTASGSGEEYDDDINSGLVRISYFIRCLNKGKSYQQPSFPPQPLLVRRSDEQLEEEGGNEEIDSQLINEGDYGLIKNRANEGKGAILNYFIEQGNQRPYWYNW